MTAVLQRLPVTLVDAFARRAGEGNRAAVLLMADQPAGLSDDQLAALARELAEPVTVFVWPTGPDRARLRWFAPSGELPSCGHGTLAAAHLLVSGPDSSGPGQISFDTPLGVLRADRAGGDPRISMPLVPTRPWQPDGVDLAGLLGVPVLEARRSDRHGLVRVPDAAAVRAVRPDLAALAAALDTVGLAVTAPGEPPYDIVSRWFVARHGLEDQATGTAHCLLAGYWAERLGRDRLSARQASANGADLTLQVQGNEVLLAGGAVTVGQRGVEPGWSR
ncbi:PhzF family phenazine biosynthesis protein [Jatrophihabitans sp.]|uniref:PhzF family phenazine biosynthesis protein n=1 Tax=Jatrophihabitans sp. TaxID=1932789 RepID=UPI002CD936B0|nr:PhzF family phenazine biosynthesis protein [Jatrophihabitans sp.]